MIETPYGRKTPELLCKAMDAYTLLPALLAIHEMPPTNGMIENAKARRDIKRAYRAAVARAREILKETK